MSTFIFFINIQLNSVFLDCEYLYLFWWCCVCVEIWIVVKPRCQSWNSAHSDLDFNCPLLGLVFLTGGSQNKCCLLSLSMSYLELT